MAKIKNQNLIIIGGKEPVLQEKSVEITENTTTTITADEGFDGLKSLEVTTNVAGSGGGSDNFKALVEGTMTELTAEDLAGIANIRPSAFQNTNIEKATIPSNVQTIGNGAFQLTKLKEIVFSEGLKSIGLSVFYGSSSARLLGNQTSLIFPSTLETMGNYAFSYSDLSKVTEIYFPDSVTSLGVGCFTNILLENCNITFGSGITFIPAGLFQYAKNKADNYTSKVYFRFNGDVTSIANEAFGSVKGARLFDFRNCTSVPTLGALSGITSYTTRNFTIVVPDALYDSWRTATNWSTIKSKIKKVSEYTG